MKPGPNAGGRPRGDRFKEIVQDLQAMIRGESASVNLTVPFHRNRPRPWKPG